MDDKELRELLTFVVQNLKEQRQTLSSVLAEVAAVRDALIEIGPAYDDILTRHRAKHVQESRPILGEIIQQYEQLLERLR